MGGLSGGRTNESYSNLPEISNYQLFVSLDPLAVSIDKELHLEVNDRLMRSLLKQSIEV
ncbi:hypothetical protein [Cylindrospermum sp. FACHB-282]|uniref:hypothetical protein n=1 Tax=Cylindrospermum sp. FACHB-282 TaxID=2692794 RepID=UPI001681C8B6|nr:hypothetical protein [Cylindrospermum sp. FACHB-282]MBD2387453.1 hypothetical protein [Cylindrospermum sp. FACHB-282]